METTKKQYENGVDRVCIKLMTQKMNERSDFEKLMDRSYRFQHIRLRVYKSFNKVFTVFESTSLRTKDVVFISRDEYEFENFWENIESELPLDIEIQVSKENLFESDKFIGKELGLQRHTDSPNNGNSSSAGTYGEKHEARNPQQTPR